MKTNHYWLSDNRLLSFVQEFKNTRELKPYHEELVRMLDYIEDVKRKVNILVEWRDTAWKWNLIKNILLHLNPRLASSMALNKPTDDELLQWYFQRYVPHLAKASEFKMFDRSWYNRAMVEPVMWFCSKEQYEAFMEFVTHFEKNLISDNSTDLIKIYLSVEKRIQAERLVDRQSSILTDWKSSFVDQHAQEKWGYYSHGKYEMLRRTHTDETPWHVIDANDRHKTRLETAKLLINNILPESERSKNLDLEPDSNIIRLWDVEAQKMKDEWKIWKIFDWDEAA